MQGKRRSKTGRVVSNKMDKTVVVSVERLRRHPIYKRVVRLLEQVQGARRGEFRQVGDTVRIEESRPLSRRSAGAVVEIVARGSHEELVG